MGGHGHGVREERTHHGARIRIGAIEDPFCLIRKCKRRGGEKRSIHHLLGDAIAVGRRHRVRMMHIRGSVGIIITQQKKGEGDFWVCHANPLTQVHVHVVTQAWAQYMQLDDNKERTSTSTSTKLE